MLKTHVCSPTSLYLAEEKIELVFFQDKVKCKQPNLEFELTDFISCKDEPYATYASIAQEVAYLREGRDSFFQGLETTWDCEKPTESYVYLLWVGVTQSATSWYFECYDQSMKYANHVCFL